VPTVVIQPKKGLVSIGLGELWAYRELLYFLAWRDVKIRYKQTALGMGWAIIQPVGSMVVFTIFFGGLGDIPSDGKPYALYTFVALLPWQLFSHALGHSSQSMVSQSQLVTKIYCPRLIIPVSSVLGGLVDFAVAFTILIGLMVYYGELPSWQIVFLPAFIFMAITTAIGIGLWFAAFNVHYRDVRYTMPFLTQFLMFMSPIVYPSSMIPEQWQLIYSLNPIAGVVDGFRWALLGTVSAPGPELAISAMMTFAVLLGGVMCFRHLDHTFADVV